MVRLVFRPYTQIGRSICTSESLRASTRVSSGFTLFRHSSPSFGSQQACSYSNLSEIRTGRPTMQRRRSAASRLQTHFHCATGFRHPTTRTHVRLLGPCFKTGRMRPFHRQRPRTAYDDETTRPHDRIEHCTQSKTRRTTRVERL